MEDIYKLCEVTIHYEPQIKASQQPKIACSQDIYKLLIERVFDMKTIQHKEFFYVLLINRSGRLIGVHLVSQGGLNGTIADVRIIMQTAILSNASGIILCHNHPSENTKPSNEDDSITKKVKKACNLMEIRLLDHIIVSSEGYYSYTDEGVL